MPRPRTPRQAPGEELVACSIMVTPATKDALTWIAIAEQRSISQIGRRALEAYVQQRDARATSHETL